MKNGIDLARSLPEHGGVNSKAKLSGTHVTSMQGAAWLGVAHLIVDAVCVSSVLRASPPSNALGASALAFVLGYDLLAFAGQVPFGWLIDRLDLRRGAGLLGIALTALALLAGQDGGYAVVLLAGAGNAIFHAGAGAMALAGSNGRAAPAGVFVAPGALGLGIGLLLGRKFLTVPLWPWYVALAAAFLMVLLVAVRSPVPAGSPGPAEKAAEAPPPFRLGAVCAIASLLCLSVAVRSLVGTVGCDACDKTLFLGIALPGAVFLGKLSGGFLADRFGWIDLSMVALLASAPLLAFSGGDLWLAMPGMILFQMTMPVTLTAIYRLMPARPAYGFGLLCFALIIGTLPAFLPGGWRPQGIPVLLLVLASAVALYLALRRLLSSPRCQPQEPAAAIHDIGIHPIHPMQR
jgi:MFS transporter, FSR family, fosmidomycin resistance protein